MSIPVTVLYSLIPWWSSARCFLGNPLLPLWTGPALPREEQDPSFWFAALIHCHGAELQGAAWALVMAGRKYSASEAQRTSPTWNINLHSKQGQAGRGALLRSWRAPRELFFGNQVGHGTFHSWAWGCSWETNLCWSHSTSPAASLQDESRRTACFQIANSSLHFPSVRTNHLCFSPQ